MWKLWFYLTGAVIQRLTEVSRHKALGAVFVLPHDGSSELSFYDADGNGLYV